MSRKITFDHGMDVEICLLLHARAMRVREDVPSYRLGDLMRESSQELVGGREAREPGSRAWGSGLTAMPRSPENWRAK